MIMKKHKMGIACCIALSLLLTGCATTGSVFDNNTSNTGSTALVADKDSTVIDLSTAGDELMITKEGSYTLTGAMTGMVVVDAEDAKIKIFLNGASITNPDNAAIFVKSAKKVTILTVDGSDNTLTSGAFDTIDDVNVDGVIFSKSDLNFDGTGNLVIDASKADGHGIVCKDDLKIKSGNIDITAAKTAIQANDSVTVEAGNITIKAGTKGIHCDSTVDILGGDIIISESNEGIEAACINIVDGNIDITAKDDGINATNGNSAVGGFGRPGATNGNSATNESNVTGENNTTSGTEISVGINISGGTLKINADGDGLDSNGTITVTGGVTYVSGPTSDKDGSIDYENSGTISGGVIIAAGSAGMAETLSSDTQGVIQITATGQAGDKVVVTDSTGKELLSWTAEKSFANIVISTPDLRENETYNVQVADVVREITLEGFAYSEGGFGGFGGFGGQMGGGPMGGMRGDQGDFGNFNKDGNNDFTKDGNRNFPTDMPTDRPTDMPTDMPSKFPTNNSENKTTQ